MGNGEQGGHEVHAVGDSGFCQHKADEALHRNLRLLQLGETAAGLDDTHHEKEHQQGVADGFQRSVDADDDPPDAAAPETLGTGGEKCPNFGQFIVPGIQSGVEVLDDPVVAVDRITSLQKM